MSVLVANGALGSFSETILDSSLNTCERWAAKRTRIPFNGEAIPFSLERYPFAKEIINSYAREIYVPKAAQMGLTSVATRKSIYKLVKEHKSGMYVLPTGEEVEDFSKTRIQDELLKESPYLKARIDASIRVYRCGIAALYMAGATKDSHLKSKPILFMVLDEADEIRERAVGLAKTRLMGQTDTQFLMFSTPTYPEFGIDLAFQLSTQKHYFFRCNRCNQRIELNYPEDFVLCGDNFLDPDVDKSYWKCASCKRQLPSALDRCGLYLESGIWVPSKTEKVNRDMEGYYIHRGYSTIKTDGDFGREVFLSEISSAKRREFHNSVLGRPFSDDNAQITDADITNCIKPYTIYNLAFPKNYSDLVMVGIDQGDIHFWVAMKFWLDPKLIGDLIDRCRGRLIGFGKTIDKDNPWYEMPSVIRNYQAYMVGCDIDDDRRGARSLARQFPRRCFPIDYVRGRPAREIRVDEDESDVAVAKTDRTAWLTATFNFVKSGRLELPSDIPLEFRDHLKGLVLRDSVLEDGSIVRKYVRLENKADHWLHAICYALTALKLYETHGIRPNEGDNIGAIR